MVRIQRAHREEGVALVTVLGLLMVFMLLGTAWLRYMAIEYADSDLQIDRLRAQYGARGGIQAGISEVQAALAAGSPIDLTKAYEFEMPVYKGGSGSDATLAADTKRVCRVEVRLNDECGRININHAPANVLRKILGVDGEKARQIRSSLPRMEGEAVTTDTAERRWFACVDELVTRGLVDAATLTPQLSENLTVYTVADPAKPVGYMNVNSASAPVLEALLDVTPDVAQKVVEARVSRPFSDVTELSAAAGKDPATFNVRPEPDALNTLPPELSFASRCYRIASTAYIGEPGDASRTIATEQAEAVVCFDAQGSPHIMYWSDSAPGSGAESAQDAAPETSPAKAE